MANNENLIPIPGRLHSVATEGHVSGADEIYDDTQQKDQETINSELIAAVGTGGSVDSRIAAAKAEIIGNATSACDTLGEAEALISAEATARQSAISNVIGDAASDYNTLGKLEDKIQAEATRAEAAEEALDGRVDTLEEAVGSGGSVDERIAAEGAQHYLKSETYTKSEINGMITTPDQEYVTVTATDQTTAITDILPATGEADTLYRVGNWDGTQYDATCYSEYAWNTTLESYVKLSTKNVGIDDEPTVDSENLVKSGGVAKLIERAEVQSNEYISVTVDKYKKIIEATDTDGEKHLFCGFTNEAKTHKCDKNPEFVEALLDSHNKILETTSKNGTKTFYGDVVIKGSINTNGFDEETLSEIKDSVIAKNAFLRLPNTLHICQGLRSQIYAHEMIAGDYSELYHVNDQYDNFLSPFLNVGKDNVGKFVRNIQIRDSQGVVAEKSLTIDTFANPSKEVSLKILQFGDSKSANKSKFAELMNLIHKDGDKINITWLGNQTEVAKDSDGNSYLLTNQAVSGTTLFDYLTSNEAWNIFYDANLDSGVNITARLETKPVKFSIAKAIETLGVVPDIIWCDHGANETWDYYFPDSTIIACYDYLINDIKEYNQAHNTNIKLVISDQEGSGLSDTIDERIRKNVSQYWRRLHLYTERIQDRESEGIYLCPNWLFVDLYNDFPMAEVPTNSCNKQLHKVAVDTIHCGNNGGPYYAESTYNYGDFVRIGEDMFICVNENPITGIYPNDDKINWAKVIPDSINPGYWHIGHAYYHTLKYIVSRDY